MNTQEWQPEWDNHISDREKQIIRIAHELADRHGELSIIIGQNSWVHLVYPFYKKYELSSEERWLFVYEYHAQLYLNQKH